MTEMKNKPFPVRLGFAFRGIRSAWATEASFRTQVVMALGALAVLIALRPKPVWWGIFILAIGAVLACEMINTALEHIVDRLHPESHPMIAIAKDCAAGAVLILSIASALLFLVFVISVFQT